LLVDLKIKTNAITSPITARMPAMIPSKQPRELQLEQ
jgi:hypothetical protein